MAEKCINCISARPTLFLQTPWGWYLKTVFRLKFEKKQKIHDFQHKKGGCHFFNIFDAPPPTPHDASKKWISNGRGRGSSGVWTTNSLGDVFIRQNNDFTIYQQINSQGRVPE